MSPNITEIASTSQYDSIVSSLAPTQLLVIDFHAVWCGPCHAIAPVLEKMADFYKHVKFVKIDVDKQAPLAQRFGVRAMPTFKFIKGGREVAEVRGANPPQLQQLIAHHAGPAPAATSTKPAATTSPAPESSSLLSQITSKGLTCLNESKDHGIATILGSNAGPKGSSYLESDVDPELLIAIPFNESVKLKSIQFFCGVSPSQAPKTVKLFINHLSLDFSDTESLVPAQELEMTPEDVKGNPVVLRFVKFQNVRSLHILIKDNQEDEETTRIDSIELFGSVGEASDKGPLPKHDHAH